MSYGHPHAVPQPGMQFITKEDLTGQHIQNATIQECDVINCTLTNCSITKADFKGTCTLQNCTTREIDVYGTVTVQGGSFTWGEVKPGGQVIDQGAHIADIDGYFPQSGYPSSPPAYGGAAAGGAMAGGAMAGSGGYVAQQNAPGGYQQQQQQQQQPGGQFITKEDLTGQHIQNATIQECEVVNCTFTNCNITKADFKGMCTLQNCTTREIDVYGTVTVQGGSFCVGEVKPGGQVIDQGAHIADIDGYFPQSGYGGGPPPGAAAGGAMAGGAMAGGAYSAQQNAPPPLAPGAHGGYQAQQQPPQYSPPNGMSPPPQQGMGQPPQGSMVNPAGQWGGEAIGAWEGVKVANKLVVAQEINWLEVAADQANCCEACCERPNLYKVYNEHGVELMQASEKSEFCNRCCCNPRHTLTLTYVDSNTQEAIAMVDRPCKLGGACPALIDCCQHEMTVFHVGNSQDLIGSVKQPPCGGMLRPELHLGTTREPVGNYFANITGPCCCFGGVTEMCCDQVFEISSDKQSVRGNLGSIVKVKGDAAQEFLTDADTFHLNFVDRSFSGEQKMTLLTSLLLLDYMFFEQNSPFECRPCAGEGETCCSITLFEMYCCGLLCPCTIKCKK